MEYFLEATMPQCSQVIPKCYVDEPICSSPHPWLDFRGKTLQV